MASLRRNMRAFAAAWLLFQVTWLLALVPRDCCAGHRPAAPKVSCHESAAGTHTPTADLDARPLTPVDCRMGGACDGPMAALFALLSNHGILPDSTAIAPNVDVRRVSAVAVGHTAGRFQPPDPPPPRA
jgi:hypothetical protein